MARRRSQPHSSMSPLAANLFSTCFEGRHGRDSILASYRHLEYVCNYAPTVWLHLERTLWAPPRSCVLDHPGPFLETVLHEIEPFPGLTGLDAGYEGGAWRAKQLAAHLFHWLPEFALSFSEYSSMNHADALEKLQRAAKVIYNTDKYGKRGEFGELLLHIALRQVFKTLPAISKIYFKDAANDTVKGFDAVHVVASVDSLELWLGEAKFYEDIAKAVTSVVEEIEKHTSAGFLRAEFLAIANKIDATWPHSDKLKKLIHPNTSLDDIFDSLCIPVLLTYDSTVLAAHNEKTQDFLKALEAELREHHASFCDALKISHKIRVHLFLVPLNTKKILVEALHEQLALWHKI